MEYRQTVEDEAKRKYLESQIQRIDAEEQLEKIEKTIRDVLESPVKDIDSYVTVQNYIEKLEDNVRAQKAVIAVLIDEEEKALQTWHEKRKDSTVLQNMHDKQLAEWMKELGRFEQNELDEWSSSRSNAA